MKNSIKSENQRGSLSIDHTQLIMADILPSSLSPQSNDGAADDSLDASARKSSKRQSGNQGSQASVQSGPPYICPTCQTNYSRLEYLRRHERRRKLI